jgi:mRNA interferase MazF
VRASSAARVDDDTWRSLRLGDTGRLGRGVITVVPVTSNITRIYPFQVLLPASQTGLQLDSKTQSEQIRSVAVERVGGRLGQLPAALITELDRALRVHLSL